MKKVTKQIKEREDLSQKPLRGSDLGGSGGGGSSDYPLPGQRNRREGSGSDRAAALCALHAPFLPQLRLQELLSGHQPDSVI